MATPLFKKENNIRKIKVMTNEEKVLVDKYRAFKKAEEDARENAQVVLHDLSLLAPHKVGEIIKWTETKRKRIGGSVYRPIYKDMPPEEMKAVLVYVKADVFFWREESKSLTYNYVFSPLKKDGRVSCQHCNPRPGYEWTGEMYDV